jgi:alkylation response protein AidB-like acyl-CoA dehydrogenase
MTPFRTTSVATTGSSDVTYLISTHVSTTLGCNGVTAKDGCGVRPAGFTQHHHFSLAKAVCTERSQRRSEKSRELLGGKGILLDRNVGRFVADAETVLSV